MIKYTIINCQLDFINLSHINEWSWYHKLLIKIGIFICEELLNYVDEVKEI